MKTPKIFGNNTGFKLLQKNGIKSGNNQKIKSYSSSLDPLDALSLLFDSPTAKIKSSSGSNINYGNEKEHEHDMNDFVFLEKLLGKSDKTDRLYESEATLAQNDRNLVGLRPLNIGDRSDTLPGSIIKHTGADLPPISNAHSNFIRSKNNSSAMIKAFLKEKSQLWHRRKPPFSCNILALSLLDSKFALRGRMSFTSLTECGIPLPDDYTSTNNYSKVNKSILNNSTYLEKNIILPNNNYFFASRSRSKLKWEPVREINKDSHFKYFLKHAVLLSSTNSSNLIPQSILPLLLFVQS